MFLNPSPAVLPNTHQSQILPDEVVEHVQHSREAFFVCQLHWRHAWQGQNASVILSKCRHGNGKGNLASMDFRNIFLIYALMGNNQFHEEDLRLPYCAIPSVMLYNSHLASFLLQGCCRDQAEAERPVGDRDGLPNVGQCPLRGKGQKDLVVRKNDAQLERKYAFYYIFDYISVNDCFQMSP